MSTPQMLWSKAECSGATSIAVWDEQAWRLLVTQVTVYKDGRAEFLFKGENRITVRLDRYRTKLDTSGLDGLPQAGGLDSSTRR